MQTESRTRATAYNEASQLKSAILTRAGIYGAACMLYFMITLLCTQSMNEPDRGAVDTLLKSAEDVACWLPGFLLLIPIAAHDLTKLTSQVAKPIIELRCEFQHLIAGQSERPLVVVEGDYWNELTGAYNRVRGELLQLRKQIGDIQDKPDAGVGICSDQPLIVTDAADTDLEETVKLLVRPMLPTAMAIYPSEAQLPSMG